MAAAVAHGDADRGREVVDAGRAGERGGEGVADAVDDGQRAGGRADVLEEDEELVRARAGDRVAGADRRAEALGDLAQQLVADVVAAQVVDRAEAVEVEREQRHVLAPPRAVEQQAAVREPGQGVVRDRVAQPRGRARPAHRVGEHVADVPYEGGLGSVEAAGRARRRDEDREGGGGAARRDRQPGDDALRAQPRQAGQRVVGRRGVEGQRVPGGQRRAREGAVDGEAGAAGRRHGPADGATEGEAPLPRHDLEHGRELGPEAGGHHAGGALEQLGRGHAGQRALAQRRELLLAAGPPLQRTRRVQARGGVDEHGLGAGPVGRVTGVHADVDGERRPIGAQRVTQAARAEALGEDAVERAAEQRPGSDAQQRVGGGVGGPDAPVGVHGEHRHRKLVERRGRRGRRVGAALEREHERGVATAPADGGLDADRHGRGPPSSRSRARTRSRSNEPGPLRQRSACRNASARSRPSGATRPAKAAPSISPAGTPTSAAAARLARRTTSASSSSTRAEGSASSS